MRMDDRRVLFWVPSVVAPTVFRALTVRCANLYPSIVIDAPRIVGASLLF